MCFARKRGEAEEESRWVIQFASVLSSIRERCALKNIFSCPLTESLVAPRRSKSSRNKSRAVRIQRVGEHIALRKLPAWGSRAVRHTQRLGLAAWVSSTTTTSTAQANRTRTSWLKFSHRRAVRVWPRPNLTTQVLPAGRNLATRPVTRGAKLLRFFRRGGFRRCEPSTGGNLTAQNSPGGEKLVRIQPRRKLPAGNFAAIGLRAVRRNSAPA